MKDQIIKFLGHKGKISVVCASTTNLVQEARKLHDLSPLATAAMGRVLTITALIVSEMKNKTDKLTIINDSINNFIDNAEEFINLEDNDNQYLVEEFYKARTRKNNK